MDYKKIYTENYFSGKDSFFYQFGYGKYQTIHFKKLFKQVKPYINYKQTGNVLDIGCAYGIVLEKFPENWSKFGIDISEHAIQQAKKRLPKANLKVLGAEDQLPYPENFFDVVLLNDVLEHLQNPEKALKNVLKNLKTDGILYITTPNLNFLRKKLFKKADEKEHHISLKSHSELLNLLKQIGFKIEKKWTFTVILGLIYIKFKSNLGIESGCICKKST